MESEEKDQMAAMIKKLDGIVKRYQNTINQQKESINRLMGRLDRSEATVKELRAKLAAAKIK